MLLSPLPPLLTEPLVRAALSEDFGRAGDITSAAVLDAGTRAAALFVAREPGVLAGIDLARQTFALVDPDLRFVPEMPDGTRLRPGDLVARVEGTARSVLAGERVALNFLGHLSGIATATRGIADAIAHTRCRVACTRKTTPGLRAVEKYAVRCGGGANHRFGLDDAILIKDNHIALAGGVGRALRRARDMAGHLVKIELEVDSLGQLKEALAIGADAYLLDNMDPPTLRQAVAMIGGRAIAEASGRITPDTAPAMAETGVDLISVGWITHSAHVLDIGLDL